ncbi:M36 family metallopeptidase [Actinoplanes sp. TRM 88003]|uniref:M36 family metallopeptidase n=1 Tax=Paractinoplanes aksuensis TaxID=2939490 RepID=A0ABT1DZ48_9ACTN|nr:M36 family metallopeptidase [Actinoplanes aksuensis]MCO8276137.1 M36 family metallopeptidase [Actinoplanes aksuensis]
MGAAAAGVVLLASLLPAQAQAAPLPGAVSGATDSKSQRRADYDSRQNLAAAAAAAPTAALSRAAVPAPSGSAVNTLRDSLGIQGIVDIDRASGTPRRVAKLDGFLTGPSKQKPTRIALDYVKAHPEVFGLSAAALASLELRQDYVDIEGTHHLSWVQVADGVPVFGNGLKAHVAKDGRLVQVDGAPLKSLPSSAGAAKLSATAARATAVRDVFGTSTAKVTRTEGAKTVFADNGNAKKVWFQTASGPRLAWQTIVVDEGYVHVIDATSGEVLYRQSTVANDSADVWTNYPGAARGGQQKPVDLNAKGWLPDNARMLSGNVAHVYSDVNDNDLPDASEEVGPSGLRKWNYPFVDFNDEVGGLCSDAYPCSWDPETPNSWQTNRKQNAVQLFTFLGTFHDHLKAGPIGFTRAAGNFEARDGDAVQGQAMDGANTADGLPDPNHVDNANMNTPPDGIPPVMQMYLLSPGPASVAANTGDEADVVFHEYTHGLSNRLVVDAAGNSTLSNQQGGSMGEAWSDFYAWDYLVAKGLEKDTAKPGEVLIGKYWTAGGTIRYEALDCPVGSTSAACPGTPGAGPGGFTYGDYGKIYGGGPEVHADGEIWAQTLWDLRTAIGSKSSQSLVTRGMELSPANPSFLDMRNSILAADRVVNNGKNAKAIWKVFAKRGMGYFAASIDGDDAQPVEDFSLPPSANTPRGTLKGKATDADTGAAVAGLTVAFGGHASGFAGDYRATTAADGSYSISGIIPGTYAKVFARGSGYDIVVKTLSINSGTKTENWSVRKDWAASSGGAGIVSFTGPDYTPFGCGPAQLIDQSQISGWGSDVAPEGVNAVIRLSGAVDVSELVINPSATCGDDETASTGGYRVETSVDGTTWAVAASGSFPNGTVTPTPVALAAGTGDGIQFVRYTMLTTQGQDAGLCPAGQPPTVSGCVFQDSTELAVYGPAA